MSGRCAPASDPSVPCIALCHEQVELPHRLRQVRSDLRLRLLGRVTQTLFHRGLGADRCLHHDRDALVDRFHLIEQLAND
jgi:hypothetical protein